MRYFLFTDGKKRALDKNGYLCVRSFNVQCWDKENNFTQHTIYIKEDHPKTWEEAFVTTIGEFLETKGIVKFKAKSIRGGLYWWNVPDKNKIHYTSECSKIMSEWRYSVFVEKIKCEEDGSCRSIKQRSKVPELEQINKEIKELYNSIR